MSEITIAKAKEQIQKAIDQNGPYSHNIAGLVLSQVASEHGVDVANQLVEEFKLTRRFGIRPVVDQVRSPAAANASAVVHKAVEETYEERQAKREAREAAERKAKRQVVVGKLVNLSNEIEAVAPGYLKYVEPKNLSGWGGEPDVYLEAKSEIFDDVYARVVYKRGWSGYHETGKVYVRIETSDWDSQFKKNWTFDTKDLSAKVLAKVRELIQRIETKREARIEERKTAVAVKELLTNRFPASGESYVSGNYGSVYTQEGKVQYNISYDTYGIEVSGLTFEQLERIRAIKRENPDA